MSALSVPSVFVCVATILCPHIWKDNMEQTKAISVVARCGRMQEMNIEWSLHKLQPKIFNVAYEILPCLIPQPMFSHTS